MEKVYVGWSTSSSWTAPAIQIIAAAILVVVLVILEVYWILFRQQFLPAVAVPAALYLFVRFVYMNCGPANTDKYLVFTKTGDQSFANRWRGRRIPISVLVIGYLDGRFEFVDGDVLGALRARDEFVSYRVSPETFYFLLSQFFPGSVSFYDKLTSKREIADHYDRHSDFFAAFLGPSMVYTCGIYHDHEKESLEAAQARKMSLVCRKLGLEKGQTLLDIGCGWGSLARHAEKHFGAKATGVTLSNEGARFCGEANKKNDTKVEILTMDYRDIPRERIFDHISSIEMAEHVGIANFQSFLGQVKAHLSDDGMFLMQVSGLKQGANFEDVAWGLFMSQYVFPAADASTPLHWYARQLELAGFEIRSVETIGRNYSHTLHAWYRNFMKNEKSLPEEYDQRLKNMWKFFLAWSVIAAGQGSCTCYQFACHKNTYAFDRDKFVGKDTSGLKIHPDPLYRE